MPKISVQPRSHPPEGGERTDVASGSSGHWETSLRNLRSILPFALAAVLVVFAVRVASEASKALKGFNELSSSAEVLVIDSIEGPAALAQRYRRLLVSAGANALVKEDVETLRTTLTALIAAAYDTDARFERAGETALSGNAKAVFTEGTELLETLEETGYDKAAARSLVIRLDSLDATISRLRDVLQRHSVTLNARHAELEAAVLGAMEKMFASLLGAIISILALLYLNRRTVRQAEYRADHDPVTGLINRRAFETWLADPDKARVRYPSAVVIADIDDFKQVNDELGHVAGDTVLKSFAQVFEAAFGRKAMVLRWGGDEFAALVPLEGIAEAGVVSMIRAAFDRLQMVVELGSGSIAIRSSAGVALHPSDDKDLSEVLKLAELALLQAKRRGKARMQFYDSSLLAERHRVIGLRGRLRTALSEKQLEVYWQPQVDIARGTVPSAEALIRWYDHCAGTFISPMEFIPAIESTDLIIELDHFVLESAISAAAEWSRRWDKAPMVAVNVSAIHFQQREFVALVSQMLRRHGVPPDRLELEITEGVILGQNDEVRRNLDGLVKLGVRIALDDFGTGYSNVAYLAQLRPDRLKIDQTFVRNLGGSDHMKSLVAAILGIGRAIDCEVVAEGVETEEQVEILRGLGCRLIQGYFFAKPMPVAEFVRWCDANWMDKSEDCMTLHRIGA